MTSLNRHQDMLRAITRNMASTQDLSAVLASVVNALVEQSGMVTSRIWLLQDDGECDFCLKEGPVGLAQSYGARALHLAANAGMVKFEREHHIMPVDFPSPPARVISTREAIRLNGFLDHPSTQLPPDVVAVLRKAGAQAAAAYPLIYHGELLGSIGLISARPLDDDEFTLLGIFADQAAMAIRSAQLYRQVARYRDRLEIENAYLQQQFSEDRGYEGIVGTSPQLKGVLRKVQQVAPVDSTVLLLGETGTGKELIARALHEGSGRKDRPLIKVNCGAIPSGLVESELFGHEKGAFTGAIQRRIGRFELADQGTLFMDEVGELPLDTQVKLLRVLQEKEFERLGSTKPQRVDVRLIAATHKELEQEVADGRFRADLFYRLNVFPIRIPPLRDRPKDIPLLVQHFLAQFQRKLAKPLKGFTPESMARLCDYHWPGNIRELQNVVERACVLAEEPIVDIGDALRSSPGRPTGLQVVYGSTAPASAAPDEIIPLEDNERLHIRRALDVTKWKIHGPGGAADLLGINPSTLRSRMQKLGIVRS
ncbi:MAG: sigma 54-interacting transcriptional regulator [Gemmatimonadales bacterium]